MKTVSPFQHIGDLAESVGRETGLRMLANAFEAAQHGDPDGATTASLICRKLGIQVSDVSCTRRPK